ncbi:MAG TPA: hypothetical protein VJA66_09315 [Thermoanaerobaculia bacterium]
MLRGFSAAVAGITFAGASLFAQTPTPTPVPEESVAAPASTPPPETSAAPSPSPTPNGAEASPAAANPAPTDTRAMLDEIGGCVESGKLNVDVDLIEGQVPAAPKWMVQTKGTPHVKMTTTAAQGRIERLNVSVSDGTLLVAGKGLRPKVYLQSVAFEDGKGITDAKFRGKGIWRPIVAIFRGLAMSAVRKLEFRTDIPSILRGEILAPKPAAPGKKGAAPPPATPTPEAAATAPAPSPTPGPSFMDLVAEARVTDSEFVAFAGKPLGMGDMVRFQTATHPEGGAPLRVSLDKASYVPARVDSPARIDAAGRMEGEIENGNVGFGESRATFSKGELKSGTFHIATSESGKFETRIGASAFSVELTSGEVRLPGGSEVNVGPPSRFAFHDLKVEPDGRYSAVLDADLTGKVGRIVRAGSAVSASNVHLRTQGARIVTGHATGDLDLEFDYRLDYLLVVHYPMKEVGEKKVPLVFQGPFSTRLHYEDVSADGGTITGDYHFKVPWPPVETAALEVLKAKWSQDVTPALKRVAFDIEPRRFSPCGDNCFLLELGVTAEKKSGKKSLFRQICEPQGKADLVVDAPSRSFRLTNIKLTTHCKGVVGWFINLITPLLTKTYTDMTLFQLPESLPFTIEKVGTGANWVAISGSVDYARAAPAKEASVRLPTDGTAQAEASPYP